MDLMDFSHSSNKPTLYICVSYFFFMTGCLLSLVVHNFKFK